MKEWFKKTVGWPMPVFFAVSFLLVYIIPPHWMRAMPGMNEFLEFVPAQLPGIQKYIDVSNMPEIAAVFFPIMALLSPLMLIEAWRQPASPERWTTNFWGRPVFNSFRVLLGSLFLVGGSWVTYFVGGYELNAFPIKDSRLYLALLGGFSAGGGAWIFMGLLTRAIYSIFSKEIPK